MTGFYAILCGSLRYCGVTGYSNHLSFRSSESSPKGRDSEFILNEVKDLARNDKYLLEAPQKLKEPFVLLLLGRSLFCATSFV